MCIRDRLKIIDRLLQDLCDENDKHKPFGVKTILLCGDFRQILPVVPHGSRATLIENLSLIHICVKLNIKQTEEFTLPINNSSINDSIKRDNSQ